MEYLLCLAGGCPKVKIEDKEVEISDDQGGRVKLTLEEAKRLSYCKVI